jgi:hypothetical protein
MGQQAGVTVHRSASRTRQAAQKLGINIPVPSPSLPETELEQTDTM